MPGKQPAYFSTYRSVELTRGTQGVLVVEFHSNGGPLTFTAQEDAGLPTHLDPERGFDHGTYSLLAVTHAEAKFQRSRSQFVPITILNRVCGSDALSRLCVMIMFSLLEVEAATTTSAR